VNLSYVVFDVAVAVLALRSLAVLGTRARWTSTGWLATAGYGLAAAWRYAHDGPVPGIALVTTGCFIVLTAAFIIAVVRDEPQAEPLLWPSRVGPTRAEKRR
jgi:thiamine pyrophosphate-dependent acetolactate synthase large subunit-like protein